IDLQRSTITVHTFKAGLFSAAGHEHFISAPISSGSYNDSSPFRADFSVKAARMKVKPDPKVSAKDEAMIQQDMQEMTLESAKYPDIVFKSSQITQTGDRQWNLEGSLTLHGTTKPVRAAVKRTGDAYTGLAKIKQTDFGIKPITVAGGLIKVKDEIE